MEGQNNSRLRSSHYWYHMRTYSGLRVNLYWSAYEPLLVARVTYIGRSSDLYRLTHPSHGEVG